MYTNFEITTKIMDLILGEETYEVYCHMHPFVGLLEIFTHYDACCGGCEREIRVKDLIKGDILLHLDEDNYSWGAGEDPADDPYKYAEGLVVEVYDTPLMVIDIRGGTWISDFKEQPLFARLSEQANLVISTVDLTAEKESPCHLFLKWSPTTKTKKVPVWDVPAFGMFHWNYT